MTKLGGGGGGGESKVAYQNAHNQTYYSTVGLGI